VNSTSTHRGSGLLPPIAGAVLGLGAGDSLGATYEFKGPEEVPGGPLEIVGGGIFGWKRGELTDDTALALPSLTATEAVS
jgi:ADP-ribosyl-[dinitrogen reductase] hydrolase